MNKVEHSLTLSKEYNKEQINSISRTVSKRLYMKWFVELFPDLIDKEFFKLNIGKVLQSENVLSRELKWEIIEDISKFKEEIKSAEEVSTSVLFPKGCNSHDTYAYLQLLYGKLLQTYENYIELEQDYLVYFTGNDLNEQSDSFEVKAHIKFINV